MHEPPRNVRLTGSCTPPRLSPMPEMTKIERVTAVIQGRRPDRAPVSFWHHFPRGQHTGAAAVQTHLDHLQRFDLDFLKVMNDHDYPGAGTSPTVDELADLPVWRGDEPEFVGQLQLLADLTRHLKDRVLMATTIFNAWSTLRSLYRPTARPRRLPNLDTSADPVGPMLTRLIHENSSAVAQALDNIARSLANFAARCIEAGADGVFLSVRDDWVDTPANGGPGTYDRLVRPGDRRILAAAHRGVFNLLHVCGRPLDFAAFADYPVQAINWADRAAGPPIRQVAGRIRPALCAGIDNLTTLPDGTPQRCAAEVTTALDQAGGHPILIAPGCTYDPDRVPNDNLAAMCRAARDPLTVR